MFRIIFLILGLVSLNLRLLGQNKPQPKPTAFPDRPKLVVGIVVDQMRYDFLYRFAPRYGKGGFMRLLKEGFSASNCQYSYFPTYTGPGHASIYTGTTPAVHGIVGNGWFDRDFNRGVYCSEDTSVESLGGASKPGKMSPRNMKSYSVCDQLRLATNFQSKVFGIAVKDRGSILPAGHAANAAFWFDPETGNFISSSYYFPDKKLPDWLNQFNGLKLAETYKNQVWNPLLPIAQYTESTSDNQPYESSLISGQDPVFPYDLRKYQNAKEPYEVVRKSPWGNTITADLAKALLKAEGLGKGKATDFLAISFSSTDIVGHAFGPNAIETEDTYLRLDQDIASLLSTLDAEVGKGQYLVFLTADHGILETPGFLKAHKLPAENFKEKDLKAKIKAATKQQFGADLLRELTNQQVYLDYDSIKTKSLDEEKVKDFIVNFTLKQANVWRVFDPRHPEKAAGIPMLEKYLAGYYENRSGDLFITLRPGVLNNEYEKGTSHGAPYSYDSHVPCLWFGWKVKPGESAHAVQIQDIAPTISNLLHIMEPNGCTGKPITIPLAP